MSVNRPYSVFLLLTLLLYGRASAYDVLVSVTGTIIGNTCVISADSKEVNVPLGTIGTRQFLAAGDVSNIKTPFLLNLEDCGPTFVGAKVRFTGTPDATNTQLLKVDGGGANGVAVELLDSNNKRLPLDTQTDAYGSAGAGTVEIKLYARLTATGETVTPGDVSAIATWLVEYQ
jgi:type 1 fimbria pilin